MCTAFPTKKLGIEMDSAAAPYNGPDTKPFPFRPIENSILNSKASMYMLRCDLTAPFGRRVVPPVYITPIVSSSFIDSSGIGSVLGYLEIHSSYSHDAISLNLPIEI